MRPIFAATSEAMNIAFACSLVGSRLAYVSNSLCHCRSHVCCVSDVLAIAGVKLFAKMLDYESTITCPTQDTAV